MGEMPKRSEVEQIIFTRTNSMCYDTLKRVDKYFAAETYQLDIFGMKLHDKIKDTLKQYKTVREMEITNDNTLRTTSLQSFKDRHTK